MALRVSPNPWPVAEDVAHYPNPPHGEQQLSRETEDALRLILPIAPGNGWPKTSTPEYSELPQTRNSTDQEPHSPWVPQTRSSTDQRLHRSGSPQTMFSTDRGPTDWGSAGQGSPGPMTAAVQSCLQRQGYHLLVTRSDDPLFPWQMSLRLLASALNHAAISLAQGFTF